MFQKTIKKSFSLKGIGVHTNKETSLIFHPADIDFGIQFIEDVGRKSCSVKANINMLYHCKYQISLINKSFVVHTVEHLLSALYGLGITNCLIQLEGNEIPIFDGSSKHYVDNFIKNGFIIQNKSVDVKTIPSSVWIVKDNSYIYAIPNNKLEINAIIKYPHPLLEKESYQFHFSKDSFISNISDARTFGFLSDWESMKKNGYALGSNLNNTLVFNDSTIINPPLRYPNECVRHKILDFIATLSLLEHNIHASFYLYSSGHAIDLEFVKMLNLILNNEIIENNINDFNKNKIISRVKQDFGSIF
ncbi:MAG: UDP-3-O-acyl-N-acetylglucosamine deacetylase [Spirochaetota bacterium]|nr:UDP-3-O-acyl-N-acetylglucosamine deacetylase [Spirochaetota bacterium]